MSPLSVNRTDLDDGKLLAMAAFPLHAFALLLLENDHLVTALVLENGGGNCRTGKKRLSNLERVTCPRGEHILDLHGRALLGARITVYGKNVARGHSDLLALGLGGRAHK